MGSGDFAGDGQAGPGPPRCRLRAVCRRKNRWNTRSRSAGEIAFRRRPLPVPRDRLCGAGVDLQSAGGVTSGVVEQVGEQTGELPGCGSTVTAGSTLSHVTMVGPPSRRCLDQGGQIHFFSRTVEVGLDRGQREQIVDKLQPVEAIRHVVQQVGRSMSSGCSCAPPFARAARRAAYAARVRRRRRIVVAGPARAPYRVRASLTCSFSCRSFVERARAAPPSPPCACPARARGDL